LQLCLSRVAKTVILIGLRSSLCLRMHYQAVSFPGLIIPTVRFTEKENKKCILNQVLQSLWHHPKNPKLLCSPPKPNEAYLTTHKLLFSKWIIVCL
jgi:hypothetical protein